LIGRKNRNEFRSTAPKPRVLGKSQNWLMVAHQLVSAYELFSPLAAAKPWGGRTTHFTGTKVTWPLESARKSDDRVSSLKDESPFQLLVDRVPGSFFIQRPLGYPVDHAEVDDKCRQGREEFSPLPPATTPTHQGSTCNRAVCELALDHPDDEQHATVISNQVSRIIHPLCRGASTGFPTDILTSTKPGQKRSGTVS